MLVQFTVENFLSFRDRVTLSMVQARAEKSLPENAVPTPQNSTPGLLRSIALYGANAAGKSNLLDAIGFMDKFVMNSARAGHKESPIPVVPFKLDQRSRQRPSTFEIVFLWEGVRYLYGFSVDSERVHDEWYSSYPRGAERVLFERTYNRKKGEEEYYFGSSWSGVRKRITELTRPNALFISVAAQLNHKLAELVYGWFSRKLTTISLFPALGSEVHFTKQAAYEHSDKKNSFLTFLRHADLGIVDFLVEKKPLPKSRQWAGFPEELMKELPARALKDAIAYDVSTVHQGLDARGKPDRVHLDLEEESDGTQKLFAIAGPWHHVLENGCTVVIDELDVRLHPLLTEWLVRRFHSPRLNPKGAQLIFATHDAHLLQRDLFRRDQVWFIEKGPDGASSLFSLWDFRKRSGKAARKEENIRRGYLAGRYGAIPLVENLPE